jgi:O-antigen ligase
MIGEESRDTAAFAGVALLALAAPFEMTAPLVRLPAQSVSNLEVIVALACLLGAGAILARRVLRSSATPIAAPWLAFLVACALAAIVSPVSRVNALHMTGRFAAAFAVCLVTLGAATSPARVRAIARLLVAAGVLVAVLAILEFLSVGAVLRLLMAFRPGISTVGAQMRATGPLQYPTIASMYLEIVFAVAVGLLIDAIDAGPRRGAWLLVGALLLVAEAIALTFTRAGLISIVATLALAMVVRFRRGGVDRSVRSLATLAFAILVLFLASRSSDALWLRLTSEGQESWYRDAISAPDRLTLTTGDVTDVGVTVTNTGRLVWDSTRQPPVYLSYHWLTPSADRVVAFDGVRTAFTSAVQPGETVNVRAHVRAPRQPGAYRLVWDVVQEGRLWFTTEPGAATFASEAVVSGVASQRAQTLAPLPAPTVRPGRRQLWRAAIAILVARPLLGIGPDNFRLAYGPYAGIATPDARTHSNNMYLEVLAGTGLVGATAFGWLLWRIGRTVDAANLGAVCALAAIAVHGLVDSFFSFAPTYVLFAVTLGLACARPHATEIGSDAYRI